MDEYYSDHIKRAYKTLAMVERIEGSEVLSLTYPTPRHSIHVCSYVYHAKCPVLLNFVKPKCQRHDVAEFNGHVTVINNI